MCIRDSTHTHTRRHSPTRPVRGRPWGAGRRRPAHSEARQGQAQGEGGRRRKCAGLIRPAQGQEIAKRAVKLREP
eukprot:885797-Alexandrium_andersonii.AAC.1